MTLLRGNMRADLPPGARLAADTAPRAWTAATRARGQTFVDLPAGVIAEIRAALKDIRANGLTLDSVEQEDFRAASFARMVGAMPPLQVLGEAHRAACIRLDEVRAARG